MDKLQVEQFIKSVYNAFPMMDITIRYSYDPEGGHWDITHDYPGEWTDIKALKLGDLIDKNLKNNSIDYTFRYKDD